MIALLLLFRKEFFPNEDMFLPSRAKWATGF
jgi:hypothetical protein